MADGFTPTELSPLIASLTAIRDEAMKLEREFAPHVAVAAEGYRVSARNLLHYVSLRRHDVRELQGRLASLGLSSLGRLESHTLAGIDAVLTALRRLAGCGDEESPPAPPVDFSTGPSVLDAHTDALLGPARPHRSSRIMVTMPSEAATDPLLVRNLLMAGMDVMRINGAHDDVPTWTRMVQNLREAEKETGLRCRVSFDLSGPKLRTGPIEPSERILKVRPTRDVRGIVVRPGRVLLAEAKSRAACDAGIDAVLPVEASLLASARPGDSIWLSDSRQRRRRLNITTSCAQGLIAETDRTIYFFEGMPLNLFRGRDRIGVARVRGLPPVEVPIVLHKGDDLILMRDEVPGHPSALDPQGVLQPAAISCTLGGSFENVLPGHRVFLDDGKIGGIVLKNDGSRITLRVDQAAAAGAKLRSEKGINLPDSNLAIAALTPKDLEDLDFAVKHADMVCLSFVRQPEDVHQLQDELRKRDGAHLGIVMKIETRQGFDNLPRILLASLRSPPVGVMLARGDLAVEIGFERLAEVQEEILWLCEAAHVPVIWATQVLESLAKTGSPSRAEVTDAAMGVRAECVMLNKGPYVCDAVRFLGGVLDRMQAHQHKKRSMLRQLSVSRMTERDPVGVT